MNNYGFTILEAHRLKEVHPDFSYSPIYSSDKEKCLVSSRLFDEDGNVVGEHFESEEELKEHIKQNQNEWATMEA